MLFGCYAGNRNEARYKNSWDGRRFAICPSIQNASGTRVLNLVGGPNGTLNNTNTATAWARSAGRQCLLLDGTDDEASFVNNSSLQITGSITIAFWANITNNGGVSTLVSKSTGTDGEFELFADFRSGLTSIAWRPGVSTNLTSFFSGFTGAWHHFAFTCDGAASGATVTCYRNGISAGTITTNLGRATSSYALTIGRRPNASNPASMMFDDAIVLDRVMNASGIMGLYRLGRGGSYAPSLNQIAGTVSSRFNRRRRIICGANC
jgi:hypothetical protein